MFKIIFKTVEIVFNNDIITVSDSSNNFSNDNSSTHEIHDSLLETTLTRKEVEELDGICDRVYFSSELY